MLHKCFACVLLVLPFFVAAGSIPFESGIEVSKLAEHEKLRMFNNFVLSFGRKYGSPDEYTSRYAIFKDNLKTIDKLNREEQGTAVFGVTRFADITYDEFVRNFTGGRIPEAMLKRHDAAIEHNHKKIEFLEDDFELDSDKDENEIHFVNGTVYLPRKYDYRRKRAVTPVKDQGHCGSCWAFTTNANIEGVWAKKKKKLIDLSEQELLDCDTVDYACRGGWMSSAVREYVRLGGVAKSSDYPYKAQKEECKFTKSMAAVKVAGTMSIPKDESEMAEALVKYGPLSVAVVASPAFQFYKRGVFSPIPSTCSRMPSELNHSVAIVAYLDVVTREKNRIPVWVLKNSWGKSWGEKGFMRVERDINACGLKSLVSTAYL